MECEMNSETDDFTADVIIEGRNRIGGRVLHRQFAGTTVTLVAR